MRRPGGLSRAGQLLVVLAVAGVSFGVLASGAWTTASAETRSPGRSDLIVFASAVGYSNLFVIRPDGSGMRRLTKTPDIVEQEPSWSPDGDWLVSNNSRARTPLIFWSC